MTGWFREFVSADGGLQFTKLIAAANASGRLELFALDTNGQLWHAYERIVHVVVNHRKLTGIAWVTPGARTWEELPAFSPAGITLPVLDFAVTTDQNDGLNIFAAAAPNQNSSTNTGWLAQPTPTDATSWSAAAWSGMTSLPSGFFSPYHVYAPLSIAAANLNGLMIVCYLANADPSGSTSVVLYDYQRYTIAGNLKWASMRTGTGLFAAPVPPDAQIYRFSLAVFDGLNMLMQLSSGSGTLYPTPDTIYYATSNLPSLLPPGSWSTPLVIPSMSVPYPNVVGAFVSCGPPVPYPGGLAAFFVDSSTGGNTGAMQLLRQGVTVLPRLNEPPIIGYQWLDYQMVRATGACTWSSSSFDGPLAVAEDPVADKGTTVTHQLVFYLDTTDPQKKLFALPFTAPPVVASLVPAPATYSPGQAVTIDAAPPDNLDSLTVAINRTSGISLFSLGYNTGVVACWRQIEPTPPR